MRKRLLCIELALLLTFTLLPSQVDIVSATSSSLETESWWNPEWRYRRRVDVIENSGYSLTNFPVEVTFNHDGKVQPNGDDIRVVLDSIEVFSYVSDLNATHAKVMFEVNVTSSSTKTVYVYYANPDATKPNYPLVPLTILEGNTGHATIDNSVYIGWAYTSWGWSNNVELWNDFRIDFNGNRDPSDDNDLIFGDYNNRQEGIGRSRRDLQAYGLGEYQNYVCNPIFVQINFVDAWLRVYRGNRWVETIQADHLNMFSNTWDYMNYGGGSEINIVDGDVEVSMHNSYSNPGWIAFRNSISGLVFASSGFGIGGYSKVAEEYYGYSIVAKEYSDFDRRMTFDIWRTDFYPFNPYDQPPNCRIYWYGDNSNDYSKIEIMAEIFNNQPSILVGSVEIVGPHIIIDQSFVSDDRANVGSTQTIGIHAKWDNGSNLVGGTISIGHNREKSKISFQKVQTSLVGYWKFDEGSGTIAYDSSGNNNHGMLVNGPIWVDGKHGKALSFDGVNDYVEIPHSTTLDVTNEITVEAWVKPLYTDYGGTPTKVIVGKHGGWNNRGWSIGAKHGDLQDIRFHWQAGGDNYLDTATNPLSANAWTHIVGIANRTHIMIYVNGELKALKANDESVDYDYPVEIGRNGVAAGSYFRGIIDEVRIYNRTIDSSTIKVFGLLPGQKVELYDTAGVLKASDVIGLGENKALLNVSSLSFPFSGFFKIYAADGTTLSYTTPMLDDILVGDEYLVSIQIEIETIDRKEYVTNSTGWVTFNASSSTVKKDLWVVKGVNASGITFFSNLVEDPSIIWDQVNVTLSMENNQIDIERNASITYQATYGYDGEILSGSVILNDTILSQDIVGKRGYKAVGIVDDKYGLTVFTTNEVYVVFDRIKIETQFETLTPGNVHVTLILKFEYDDRPVEDAIVRIDHLAGENIGNGVYKAALSSWMPLLTINVKVEKEYFETIEMGITNIALGNFISESLVIVFLGVAMVKLHNKWLLLKKEDAFENLLMDKGRLNMDEASKVVDIDIETLKTLIPRILKKYRAQGFFINNGKEFILESHLVSSLNNMGKFSFEDLSSKLGVTVEEAKEKVNRLYREGRIKGAFFFGGFITETSLLNVVNELGRFKLEDLVLKLGEAMSLDEIKKIISELLKDGKISGHFTSDGKGFVTKERLMEEVGRGLKREE